MTAPLVTSCPLPLQHDTIQLAHGGGGRLTRELIDQVFAPAFANPALDARHDSATLLADSPQLAFCTDSYVVRPRFFAGADIGKLAVIGTVNDLAMAGAIPRWLSASFILEEGLSLQELRRIVDSMQQAAQQCGVSVVTGDTKVVDRGKGDGVFITTAGIGSVAANLRIAPSEVRAGDVLIASGDLGRHGIAVMNARDDLGLSGDIASDCAPLHEAVAALVSSGIGIHCLRDLTRGGLASALNEIAQDGGVDIAVDESAISVHAAVRGACELLGLDPLYTACEGRMVAFVAEADAARALALLRQQRYCDGAAIIGRVLRSVGPGSVGPGSVDTGNGGAAAERRGRDGRVTITGGLGATRVLDLLSGEQLPRIC